MTSRSEANQTPYWYEGVTMLDAMYATRGCCAGCGATDFSPNVEAFELTDDILCDECADAAFEESNGSSPINPLVLKGVGIP